MPWYTEYEDTKNKLCEDKPIFAVNSRRVVYMLMPRISADGNLLGFSWFNLTTGMFTSRVTYLTIDEAVHAYRARHKIYNGIIEIIEEDN